MIDTTRRHGILLAATLIAAGLGACATPTTDTWSTVLPRLQPGQSTAEEVAALLGSKPRNVVATAKGNQLHQWMDGGRSLGMVFDKQSRLMSVVQAFNVPVTEADRKRLFLPPPG